MLASTFSLCSSFRGQTRRTQQELPHVLFLFCDKKVSRCVAGIALSSSSHLAQKKSVASFVFCSVEVLVCSDQTWSDVVIVSTLQVLVLDLILVNTRCLRHPVWMTAGHDGRQRFNSLRLQSLQEILENNKMSQVLNGLLNEIFF